MSTWVCIASGPSLTKEDCDKVKGLPVISVNETWRITEGIIFAGDRSWWDVHHDEVLRTGRVCYTRSPTAHQKYGARLFVGLPGAYNSGQKAIELAAHLGATKILLLGYDYSIKNGVHWHGLHEKLRNPGEKTAAKWHGEMLEMTLKVKLPPVLNCSRSSDLKCFPIETLENALLSLPAAPVQPLCVP